MSIYKKGRRKEYAICEQLKKEGFDIVQRTAGSHSPIDIIAIDTTNKVITLIQCKRTINKEMSYIDGKLKRKIEEENKELNNKVFRVYFKVK